MRCILTFYLPSTQTNFPCFTHMLQSPSSRQGTAEQKLLRTERARNLKQAIFARMAQRHHHLVHTLALVDVLLPRAKEGEGETSKSTSNSKTTLVDVLSHYKEVTATKENQRSYSVRYSTDTAAAICLHSSWPRNLQRAHICRKTRTEQGACVQ